MPKALFYPSKAHDTLNGKPFTPETITQRVMLNPLTPAYNGLADASALVDSGAFQELATRITPRQALERQLQLRERIRSKLALPTWNYEGICIYDCMTGVDEAIINGKKIKVRGTIETAQAAIDHTLYAANMYYKHRERIDASIVYIAQGVTPDQYIYKCALPLLDFMRSNDYFGFGGFCIIGRQPSLKPLFVETFTRMMPYLKKRSITRVHLLGVLVTDMVRFAVSEARKYSITVSTDGSGPEVNGSVYGKTFINEKWRQVFDRDEKYLFYCPNELAHTNITLYNKWLSAL